MNFQYLDKQTADGTAQNLEALYQLFPSCFTEMEDVEGKMKRAINWGKLRELLGDNVADGEPEVYDFTWVGKRAAQREAMAPIRKTLRPCPEESVNWDTTQNLYIEGDNLEVLKLLQNSYMGKVKMIYIDPPYNTGKDFVYHDNYKISAKEYDEHNVDDEGNRFRKNTDGEGRFHSDWCSMMFSRLSVAHYLLRKDGVIFISIDDGEVSNLKKICDEIFGSTNFVAQFTRKGSGGRQDSTYYAIVHEYVLCYAKDASLFVSGKIIKDDESYPFYDEVSKRHYKLQLLRKWGENSRRIDRPNLYYPIKDPDGNDFYPMLNETEEGCWRWGKETMFTNINNGLVEFKKKAGNWIAYERIFEPKEGEYKTKLYSTIIDDISNNTGAALLKELFRGKIFDYPKPVDFVSRIISYSNAKDNDLIMDFFSGSATTAHSVLESNVKDKNSKRFILVQIDDPVELNTDAYSEGYKNICEIGKERIRRAGKKIKEENQEAKDLDIGFRVFKCDESNYKNVAFTPSDYSQESLELFVDNIKEDRSDLDLLFDCMLRWGITLDLPMTSTKVDGCKIHNVNEGALVACFEGRVTEMVIDAICAMEPNKVVFRDSSFEEAAQKMNLFELFKQKLGWEEQEVRNNIRVI